MTVRVIANRDKPRAHLLTVSAKQEPIVDRAVTYGPSAATEGGPHFYPFTAEGKPYKSLERDFCSVRCAYSTKAPQLKRYAPTQMHCHA